MCIQVEQDDKTKRNVIKSMTSTTTTADNYSYGTSPWVYVDGTINGCGGAHFHGFVRDVDAKKMFIPIKVIFNPPYTICIFPDGTKEKVRCTEDEVMFNKEVGVMACITKKIMRRNEFKRLINSSYVQPPKDAWE